MDPERRKPKEAAVRMATRRIGCSDGHNGRASSLQKQEPIELLDSPAGEVENVFPVQADERRRALNCFFSCMIAGVLGTGVLSAGLVPGVRQA